MITLIQETLQSIVENYSSKLHEVINWCDSPIEELLFVFLVNRLNIKLQNSSSLHFGKDIDTVDILDDGTHSFWHNKKFNFSHYDEKFKVEYRYSSVVFELNKWVLIASNEEFQVKPSESYGYRLKLEPQFYVRNEESMYFIDLALSIEELFHDHRLNRIITRIAIECDGHDYHHTKEDITKDNQRTRQLIKKGWKVIRYSGSELYKESKNDLDAVLNEIFEIIDLDKILKQCT